MRTARLLMAVIAVGCLSASPLWAQVSKTGPDFLDGNERQIPLGFVENGGQLDPAARFFGRFAGLTAFFTDTSFVLKGRQRVLPGEDAPAGVNLFLRFENTDEQVRLLGRDAQPGKVNFLKGNDPAGWVTGLRTFATLRYVGLYEGIDMAVYDRGGRMEYDLLLSPGADPARVSIRCEGGEGLSIDEDGALLIRTAIGTLRQDRPRTFSVDPSGQRVEVDCRYVILDSGDRRRFGFEVSGWSRDEDALVIDPVLNFTTFLGGTDSDGLSAIAVGPDDSLYVAGHTLSVDLPTTAGAFDESFNGSGAGADDAFVARLGNHGTVLEYATFLGGTDGQTFLGEFASAIFVDASGAAYVAGTTTASDFPTTVGALSSSRSGPQDGFVLKLSEPGDALIYSTYLGGSNAENVNGLAVDADGQAHLAGDTSSFDFPVSANAFDASLIGPGPFDGFVAVLDASGASLIYGSYFGGTANDFCLDIAVDGVSGAASVTGKTSSTDFPVSAGAFSSTSAGGQDLFAVKVDPLLPAPDFSTYLGGANLDTGNAVAIDETGAVYVTGGVRSSDFPVTPGTFDETHNGGSDAFVTKISPSGLGLVYSTYLGGSANGFYPEQGNGLALGEAGQLLIAGQTDSNNFPTAGSGVDSSLGGLLDAFFTKLAADGESLIYSTHLGGAALDFGKAVAMDSTGAAVMVGQTSSGDLATSAGVIQESFGGGFSDAFVADFQVCEGAWRQYGEDCLGSGGIAPRLAGLGCPEGGNTIQVKLSNGLGGATGFLLIGSDQLTGYSHLCRFEVFPLLVMLPIVLDGSGPGDGDVSLSFDLPASLGTGVLYLQAALFDAGAAANLSSTRALALGLGTQP